MLIKTVSTVITTNSAGQVVEALPVRQASDGETDSIGRPVDVVSVTEDPNGVPVRFVTGKAVQNSAGQWVESIAVQGGGVLPISNGLEAYWDWTGSTPLVSKVGGHELQQGAGSAVTVVDVSGGPSAKAIQLNGATDFLRIAAGSEGRLNLGANGYNAVTVFAWVKRDDADIGFIAGCWQEDNGDPRRQYGLFVDLPMYGGGQQVCGHISKTGGPTPGYPYSRDYSSNSRVVNNAKWEFVAFTYDGANIRSFLGDALDLRPTFTDIQSNTYSKNPYPFTDGLNTTPCDFTVGSVKLTAGMSNFFGGKMGPLGVYNRALSLADLTKIYRHFLRATEPVYLFDFHALASSNARGHGWQCAGATGVYTDIGGNDYQYFGANIVGSRYYMARGSTTAVGPLVGWSPELAGVPLDDLSQVRFTLNSGVTNSLLRLVIKSNGSWYASNETFDLSTPGVSGSDWSLAVEKAFAFSRDGTKWRDLNFTPGTTLALAGSVRTTDIPSGDLENIGFYSPSIPAAAIRVDDLKVFTKPA